jgi:hypothetical protein
MAGVLGWLDMNGFHRNVARRLQALLPDEA